MLDPDSVATKFDSSTSIRHLWWLDLHVVNIELFLNYLGTTLKLETIIHHGTCFKQI